MKKLSLWLTSVLAACVMLFGCVACNNSDPVETKPDAIQLSATSIELMVGESETLTATPESVTWSTSDESVATVEDGVVTAIKDGTATITVSAEGWTEATCTVTVTKAPEYAELTVDKDVVELREGGASVTVTATFTVNNEPYDCELTWASDDETIATVKDGAITPVGVGSTVVTVSVEYNGETYFAEVEVAVKPNENIQVSKGEMQLALAEINGDILSDTFTATAYKAGEVNANVTLTYASSNEQVAVVTEDEGVATVTAKGVGSCLISVSYESAYGKIETFVSVTVTRSTLVLDEMIEIPYVKDGDVLVDFTALELLGEIEGIYDVAGAQVAAADGVLEASFVEKNKDVAVPVQVRTNVAVYEAQLLIVVPYEAAPKQEAAANELVDMPTFDGDVASLGFPAGTGTVYELTVGEGEGWTKRMIVNAAKDKDLIAFDVILNNVGAFDRFTLWPAQNVLETKGSYGVAAKANDASVEADADRKIFVLGANDRQPDAFAEDTLYTIYFFVNKGESHVHFSMFTTGTIYVANIRCMDADELVYDPTLPPPPISQGEERNPMPTFGGDVTALGFAAGTTVYEIVGAQSNSNDVKLVAQVESSGDMAYAKMDFVLTQATSSLGLWITAANVHLGYYTVTPTGFTTDGLGDASRTIFVTDANGERVSTFDANTVYTLYVKLDGREATVQLTTWAALTIYVANVKCITESEAPIEPTTPPAGKDISILFIGNSFSDDTEAYMVDILLHLGYTNIDIGNLYIGGCDIDTHYSNIMNNYSAYDFRMRSHNGSKYTEYVTGTVDGKKQSIDFAIAYKDWDIISVQQASGSSGKADTYQNLNALVAEVQKKATNSEVEIVFNMTWAYQEGCSHADFPAYNSDQMTMYNAIVNAVKEKVEYTVVPNGTAIQNARTSLIGDNLTRDGYHLDLKIGRFIAGLTFVAKVTGVDITGFDYAPSGVTNKQLEIAIESVQNAINDPFAVTESQVKEDVIVEKDVMSDGSNPDAVKEYEGDVTALGFAEGTTVFEYVGVNSDTDKAVIKVDSVTYDYVEVQLVIKQGDGYFFLFGRKGDTWHNGGISYVIDPGWIRITDGNNSPSDRRIEIFDAEGKKVTSLMSTNTLYTLRVFTKVGELDQILIGKTGSTIYLANVKQGLEADLPVPEREGPIKQGDAESALPNYKGDVTALGFAEGTTVYQLVSASAWNDRVKIATDPSYKYLDVQFSVADGDWYFLVWVCDANGMLDGYYLVAELGGGTQHATFGDGFAKHNPSSGASGGNTRIQVLDADGSPVIGARENGKVYTLRVWIAEESITEVQIGQDNVTMYFGDMECTDSEPQKTIKQGDGATVLPTYTGDVTAHGFEAGERIQYMTTETVSNVWEEAEPTSGKTREQLAARIPGVSGKYVTIRFATSEDIASGSVFYVWGLLGSTHTKNGGLNFTTTTYGRILDVNGFSVSSISKNTVYVLELYIEGTDTYKVSNLCTTGMEMYFATDSITCSDESFAIQLPDASSPIQAGGSNKNAVYVYNGDETALGFAEGAVVYKYVGETTNDKISIKVDSANYDYVDVQMVFDAASTKTWVLGFVMSGSSYLNGADAYILAGDNIKFNANPTKPLDRIIQFLDSDGNVVTTALQTGVVYTLRVYIKANNVTEIQMRQTGVTMYLANVTHGIEEVIPEPVGPTAVEIKIGDDKAEPTTFDGTKSMYGFADEDEVVMVALEAATDVDDKRLALVVDSSKQYLAIDFSLEFGLLGNIYVWTVTDGGERVLAATILADGGIDDGALVDVVIKDSEGNDVTNEVLIGLDTSETGNSEKYTMYVYYNGADEVHIGCDDFDEELGGNILYFANAECNSDVA